MLWDYEPLDAVEVPAHLLPLLQEQALVEDYIVTELLFPFEEEISRRRAHETRIKEKYGLRSFDYLLQESNQKILDYQFRQVAGEAVDLPLLNEERNLKQLQQKREQLEQEIELERNLTVNDPRFLGAALIMPLPERRDEMPPAGEGSSMVKDPQVDYETDLAARKKEIELVGMTVAMAYETENGWQPADVSGENHGFDVRSIQYESDGTLAAIRYIEVKARARSGGIRLSANEWKKARRHGEHYWLYIITQAASDAPHLSRIQNPAQHFTLDEDIFATGFIIPEEKWRGRE